jgi:hypothetical protein
MLIWIMDRTGSVRHGCCECKEVSMGFLQKLDRHADLMNQMADTVNASMSDALAHDALTAQELRNAVMACMGCEGSEACPDWLAAHTEGAEEAPGYCRNRGLFERLRHA